MTARPGGSWRAVVLAAAVTSLLLGCRSADEPTAEARAPAPAPVPRAAEAGRGVSGRLLDAGGQPVAKARIRSARHGTDGTAKDLDIAVTDDQGCFTLQRRGAAAEYVLKLVGGPLQETVVLGDGVRSDLEWRLPAGQVALTGAVLQRGEPFVSGVVEVWPAGGGKQFVTTAADGQFVAFVPPGDATVRVVSGQRMAQLRVDRTDEFFLAAQVVPIAPGVPRANCRIEVATVRLDLAFAAGALPVPKLQFELVGECPLAPMPCRLELRSGDGLHASLPDLPPGHWLIRPVAPSLPAVAPRELDVRGDERELSVAFALPPRGELQLEFRDAGGKEVRVTAARLPALRVGGRDVPCVDLALGTGSARSGGELVYLSLPSGTCTLQLDDTRTAEAVDFLPFAPLPAREVAIAPGVRTKLTLQVEPRPFVELRATVGSGREDPQAVVQVFAGERSTRSGLPRQRSRWQGYLPPGVYRVVVTDALGEREDSITVDRESVRREFRR